MNAPQIIMIVLMAMGLGIAIVKDGEPHKYSVWGTFVGTVLTVALLWWGGFFG